MDRQLHRNLFDTFLYNPLTPFFKGELDQLLHYLKGGKLFFYRHQPQMKHGLQLNEQCLSAV